MNQRQLTLLKLEVKSKLTKRENAIVEMDVQANTETLDRMPAFGTTLLFATTTTITAQNTGRITILKLAAYAAMAVIKNTTVTVKAKVKVKTTDENL